MKSQLKKLAKYFKPNEKGQEVLNEEPLHVTLNIEQDDPIEVRIKKLLGSKYMAEKMQNEGFDTIEEASDFDIGGAEEVITGYEAVMMADEYISNHSEIQFDDLVNPEMSNPTTEETKTTQEASGEAS